VADFFALFSLVVFEQLHSFKGGGGGDELVGELALALVVMVVGIFCFFFVDGHCSFGVHGWIRYFDWNF